MAKLSVTPALIELLRPGVAGQLEQRREALRQLVSRREFLDAQIQSENSNIKALEDFLSGLAESVEVGGDTPIPVQGSIREEVVGEKFDFSYDFSQPPYVNAYHICKALNSWVSTSRLLEIIMEKGAFPGEKRGELMRNLSAMLSQRVERKTLKDNLVPKKVPGENVNFWGLREWLVEPKEVQDQRRLIR